MALAERATGSGASFSSPCTITLSGSPVSGDLILVFVDFNNDTSGVHPTPAITGFTSLGSSTASVWSRLTLLGKIAAGTEGTSLSLTWSGVAAAACAALVVSGADSSLPTNIITTPDASSDTTASIPAITTAAANSWDVAAVCFGGNSDYNTTGTNYSAWGSSLVEKVDVAAGSGGSEYAGVGMAYVLRASAALQAATSVTQSTADVSGAIRVEVKESAGGGGVTVNLSGSPNSVALTTVDPTTILGSLTLNLTASPNSVVLATVDPSVVLGSLTLNLTATPNAIALTTVDPTIIQGSITVDMAASPNTVVLTTVDPTVTAGGDVSLDLSSAPNTLVLTTVDPTVLNPVTLDLTAVPNVLVLTTVDPTVTAGGDITLDLSNVPNVLVLTTVNPSVLGVDTFADLHQEIILRPVTALELVARPLTTIETSTRVVALSELVTRRRG